ncbi:Hpt domain-containing protein, partial [Magnetococcales bacterium HHB-1]
TVALDIQMLPEVIDQLTELDAARTLQKESSRDMFQSMDEIQTILAGKPQSTEKQETLKKAPVIQSSSLTEPEKGEGRAATFSKSEAHKAKSKTPLVTEKLVVAKPLVARAPKKVPLSPVTDRQVVEQKTEVKKISTRVPSKSIGRSEKPVTSQAEVKPVQVVPSPESKAIRKVSPEEQMQLFTYNAKEQLALIGPICTVIEQQGISSPLELFDKLYRSVRAIKGGAQLVALKNITQLSKVLEQLLGKMRQGRADLNEGRVESLLAGLNVLQAMIEDVVYSDEVNAEPFIESIKTALDAF